MKLIALEKNFREVLHGAAAVLAMRLLGAALMFAFNVMLARVLGAKETGIFVLALMVVSITSVIGRIGLDNTMLKYIAISASSNDWPAVGGVFYRGLLISTLLSGLLALALYGLAPWMTVALFHKAELLPVLEWMLLGIVPMALVALLGESLKGLKRVGRSALVQSVIVPPVAIAGLYLLARSYAVQGVAVGYVLANVLAMAIGFVFFVRSVPTIQRGDFSYRILFGSCLPLFWVASMNLVTMWMSTGMVGVFADSKDVAIYNAAAKTAMLVSFILYGFNSITAPKFAELYHQGNIDGLERTARFSARMTTLVAIPVLLIFIFFPAYVMGMFGVEFRLGETALVIMSLGQFVNVMTGSVGYLLIMSGHEKTMRNNVLLAGTVNVLLNLMLTPSLSWLGASIATAGSMVVANLAATWLVYRKLGLKVFPWLSISPAKA